VYVCVFLIMPENYRLQCRGRDTTNNTENLVGTCLQAVRIPCDINTRARGRLCEYCRHSELTLLHSSSPDFIVYINFAAYFNLIFHLYMFERSFWRAQMVNQSFVSVVSRSRGSTPWLRLQLSAISVPPTFSSKLPHIFSAYLAASQGLLKSD
jgi:hypothetical protein